MENMAGLSAEEAQKVCACVYVVRGVCVCGAWCLCVCVRTRVWCVVCVCVCACVHGAWCVCVCVCVCVCAFLLGTILCDVHVYVRSYEGATYCISLHSSIYVCTYKNVLPVYSSC